MIKTNFLAWIYLATVWMANITDLIKLERHMYNSIGSIIFWNTLGLLSFLVIILNYREEKKDE